MNTDAFGRALALEVTRLKVKLALLATALPKNRPDPTSLVDAERYPLLTRQPGWQKFVRQLAATTRIAAESAQPTVSGPIPSILEVERKAARDEAKRLLTTGLTAEQVAEQMERLIALQMPNLQILVGTETAAQEAVQEALGVVVSGRTVGLDMATISDIVGVASQVLPTVAKDKHVQRITEQAARGMKEGTDLKQLATLIQEAGVEAKGVLTAMQGVRGLVDKTAGRDKALTQALASLDRLLASAADAERSGSLVTSSLPRLYMVKDGKRVPVANTGAGAAEQSPAMSALRKLLDRLSAAGLDCSCRVPAVRPKR